jgi:hypothetical protein
MRAERLALVEEWDEIARTNSAHTDAGWERACAAPVSLGACLKFNRRTDMSPSRNLVVSRGTEGSNPLCSSRYCLGIM